MSKRPARCYTKISGPPYTRIKKFIKSIPHPRIQSFEMGTKQEYPVEIALIINEACQIRHTALEAMRIVANRHLNKKIEKRQYWLKIWPYPHHILRENKMLAGAGADRLQEGMRRAFGKPVDRAARVRPGQIIMSVRIFPSGYKAALGALKRAQPKLPRPSTIKILKGEELLKK